MKEHILILLACLILFSASTATAQKKQGAARKKGNAATEAQRAYQNKCMSCHREARKYPEGKQTTVLLHMRVRGDLTEEETQAILRYLTR